METTPELEAMCAAFKAELTRQGVIYQPEADWPAPTDLCMSTGEKADLAAALRAALLAIREIDDDLNDDGPLAPAIRIVENYYDAKWSVTVASEVWTVAVDHILGKPA